MRARTRSRRRHRASPSDQSEKRKEREPRGSVEKLSLYFLLLLLLLHDGITNPRKKKERTYRRGANKNSRAPLHTDKIRYPREGATWRGAAQGKMVSPSLFLSKSSKPRVNPRSSAFSYPFDQVFDAFLPRKDGSLSLLSSWAKFGQRGSSYVAAIRGGNSMVRGMFDAKRATKAEATRGASLSRPLRSDLDLDRSYRAKFIADDIDEGDEDSLVRADGQERSEQTSVAKMVTRATASGSGGVAELCQYIQKLEAEKHDLVDQIQFLRDRDATYKVQLTAAASRIERLEKQLQSAGNSADAQQQTQLQIEAAIAVEREKTAAMATRLETAQRKFEDAERARQHAVFKLSELQTTIAEATTNRLLTPPLGHVRPGSRPSTAGSDAVDPTSGSNERIEKLKREVELLRQKLELREAQAQEKQKLAVELALRSAHLEHAAALEKVRLECEIKLSEWRHDEAVRAKQIEAAMDEDRYSIRLEMRHGMQRAQVEQRVYYLQAQAAIASTPPASSTTESEVSFSAMDEVLVRMQLELLRTRRFAAIKKLALIRQTVVDRAVRRAIVKWKALAMQTRTLRLHAVLHMHRIVRQFEKQDVRERFQSWKLQTLQLRAEAQRHQAAACWNRLLAVERLAYVLHQRSVKQTARSFSRWRLQTSSTGREKFPNGTDTSVNPSGDAETATARPGPEVPAESTPPIVGVELQEEIRKLHEQLASSKSEAWRYKRQLLKQFLRPTTS